MKKILIVLVVMISLSFFGCVEATNPEYVQIVKSITVKTIPNASSLYTSVSLSDLFTIVTESQPRAVASVITYTSSDTTIAKIESDMVIPLKGGSVTITVSSEGIEKSVDLTFNDVRFIGTWGTTTMNHVYTFNNDGTGDAFDDENGGYVTTSWSTALSKLTVNGAEKPYSIEDTTLNLNGSIFNKY